MLLVTENVSSQTESWDLWFTKNGNIFDIPLTPHMITI